MSHGDGTDFTSDQVDEQIDAYLSDSHSLSGEQAGQRAVQRLQRIYQVRSSDHASSLERVWQRVVNAEAQEAMLSLIAGAVDIMKEKQEEAPRDGVIVPLKPRAQRRKRALFAQLAAVLSLSLVVGGFVFLSVLAHHPQPATLVHSISASGLYGYMGNTIYRLDERTHQIIWKHTFSQIVSVQDGGSGIGAAFVVGENLYVLTRDTHGQQYLNVLNTADGTILWYQPSARAFANDSAVYTLVESRTADNSTLTARDPHTGKVLWQRHYPIVGPKSDPGRGTDTTEGFRLVTVTDQMLYAVAWYRQNGNDIFARYSLSPKDGSILWQNRETIAGRMPQVYAQIVAGVLYTTEYNLASVTPYTDSHGMYIDEIPQSRVTAYDAVSGKRLWQTPERVGDQPNGGFAPLISGDMLYYQTYREDVSLPSGGVTTLYALNVRDGAILWRYQARDGLMVGPVLEDNHIYFEQSTITTTGEKQNLQIHITALDARSGNVDWSTSVKLLDGTEKTPTPVPHSIDPGFTISYVIDMAPVASQNAVYYSTPGNRIYEIQPSDGKILTQFWLDKTDQTTVRNRFTLFVVP